MIKKVTVRSLMSLIKEKRNKRVPVVVSSDSSGSGGDETVEQIKRKRVAEIGDETPETTVLH